MLPGAIPAGHCRHCLGRSRPRHRMHIQYWLVLLYSSQEVTIKGMVGQGKTDTSCSLCAHNPGIC